MKTPWYMRVWVWLLALVVIIAIPFFINEAYKCETGYATKWSAADVLSFYGSLLSLGGSVVLGIVAVEQSRKANELAERMLTLEEQKEVPIIDIIEIADGKEPTDSNVLRNALRLSVNDCFYYFKEDNSIAESDTDVVIFELKNISSNHIISMKICDVAAETLYFNEKRILSPINSISYNGGVRVFGAGDSQYIVIGGVHYEHPDLSHEEMLKQDYVSPVIELKLEFVLGNVRGYVYEEVIKIRYTYLHSTTGINYPCMLEKEIEKIEKTER